MYRHVQWNLSITDTFGITWSVLIKEVSSFLRLFSTILYEAGTTGGVLIREMSLHVIRRSLMERFHCSLRCVYERQLNQYGLFGSLFTSLNVQISGGM